MSFDDISEEILTMVAEALFEVGELQDLASFNIALGKTSTAAARWLYREVYLDFSGKEAPHTSAIMNVLLEKPEYRLFVHELFVIMPPTLFELKGNIQSRYSSYVLKILPLLPALRSFNWQALEPISKKLMDAIRSIRNLEYFQVDLLHGDARALPKFPNLQHRAREVEQTVRIHSVRSIESGSWGMKFPRHVIRSLKGDDQGSLSTSEAPQNALMKTSHQPPVYRKLWLQGSGLFQGDPAVSPFRDMFSGLESLDLQCCELSSNTIVAITKGCNWNRLKTFRVGEYPGHERHDGDGGLSKFLQSFEGLENLCLYDMGVSDSIAHAHSLSTHTSTLHTLKVRRHTFQEAHEDLGTTFDDSKIFNMPYLQLHYQQLRSLDIDMPAKALQDESSPVVQALRRLKQLNDLSLYIPHISYGGDNLLASAKPVFTRQDAHRIAKLLFSLALQELHLYGSAPQYVRSPSRMHFSVTRSSQEFIVVDMRALTSTPEEKDLRILAKSLGAPYWPPAESNSQDSRSKWIQNLYRNVRKRQIVYDEAKGFRAEGALKYRISRLPKGYKVAGQAGGT